MVDPNLDMVYHLGLVLSGCAMEWWFAGEFTFWGFNGRWGNKEGPIMVCGFHILENGPDYPASHAITFQLDNPALENCVPSSS